MIHFLGLVLALLPTYLIRFKLFGVPTTLLELLIAAFLFLTLINFKLTDLVKLKSLGKINLSAGLFILAGIISTIVSPEPLRALGLLKAFIIEPVLLFYATIVTIKLPKDKIVVLRWLLASSFLISLFGIVQYFTYLNLPIKFWGSGDEGLRITSIFEHPNQLALYLAPLLIFFFALYLSGFKLFKVWFERLALIILGVALALTFSRGAWLAVSLMGLILLIKKYSWKQILPLVLLLVLILFSIAPIRERVMLGISDPSSSVRLQLMKVGFQKTLSSPFLGNGLYGFRTTLAESQFSGEILNNPHNIFLTFWLEMGLLGLLTFALIFFISAEQVKIHPSALKFAAGVFLLTVIIQGMVDVPYFKNDLSILFWFMISLFFI